LPFWAARWAKLVEQKSPPRSMLGFAAIGFLGYRKANGVKRTAVAG
jgi:hypothetical protein